MSDFTPGATLAWKIAAAEAAASRHAWIGKGHLLLGVLSLGKAVAVAADLPPDDRAVFQREYTRVEAVLGRLGLQAPALRRALRERLGVGTHRHSAGAAISRTESCKVVFARALALAAPGDANPLHLIAALTEGADPHLDPLLREAGVKPAELGRLALAAAVLDGIAANLEARHNVRLVVDTEAERFLGAVQSVASSDELQHAVQRWVGKPVDDLVRSGKLRRHPVWRVVHDEGGIYVIPAD